MRFKALILAAAATIAMFLTPSSGPRAMTGGSGHAAGHASAGDTGPNATDSGSQIDRDGLGLDDTQLRPPFSIAHRAAVAASRTNGPAYYILELADAPLARYHGDIDELAPTSPKVTGERKLNVDSPAARAYLRYLDARQAETIATIEQTLGRPVEVLHHYRFAYDGLALWLAPAEAARVAALAGVNHVERSVVDPLDTDTGPRLIGADQLWDGSATGGLPGTKGEGVVVGMVDTGINMDHPSFAATGADGYTHTNPLGAGKYLGWCNPSHPNYNVKYVCNAKLIGAYSFPDSSMDPEDEAGHGSHTSSTVTGNAMKIIAPTVTLDRMLSGVAPHANVVMYDACAGNGCNSTATVAAIDQATKDGVDVINYSIGIGQNSPWVNSRLVAFLGAYEAGVFVAASAGNAGNAGTVNATAPWITAVAALTHGRSFPSGLVNLTGGSTNPPGDMSGASISAGYGPAKIVYAKGFNRTDGTPDDGMCSTAFPAGTWSGEIVVCDRGGVGRPVKGYNVKAGGAGGFVLANTAAQGGSLAADTHYLPAVNISASDAQNLKTWLATGTGHMAQIKAATVAVDPTKADNMADFSSRGPAYTSVCCRRPGLDTDEVLFDVLKPDIGGPGVDIIAAVASDAISISPELGLLSGTSMSSPHLAGAAALVRALHPTWSPSQVQSALMLTAKTGVHKEDGVTVAEYFDTGAGRVDLSKAAITGLILDETGAAFHAADPDKGGRPSALNLASMTDAWSFGMSSWTRTVQSTRDTPTNWHAAVAAAPGQSSLPAGLNMTVSPANFTIAAKGTQAIKIDADAAGVPLGNWAFAQIVLTSDNAAVPAAQMPVAIYRVDRRLPPAVVIYTNQTNGTQAVTGLRAPEITNLTIDPSGLVKGDPGTGTAVVDPTNSDPFDNPTGTLMITRTVMADADRLVAEVTGSTAKDIDLFVGRDFNGDGKPTANEVICQSGRESWDELCDVASPPAGDYWILMDNFDGTTGQADRIDYITGVVPVASANNMTITGPSAVPAGQPFDLSVAWHLPTLAPGDHWYGAMRLGTDPAQPGNVGRIIVDLISTMSVPPTPTVVVPTATPVLPTATPVVPTATHGPPTATRVPPTATTAPPTPTPQLPPSSICTCNTVAGGRVPPAVVSAAVANPDGVNGWQQPLNPNRPAGPGNPPRMCLTIQNPNQVYHPMFNSLVFRAGCP